MIYEALRDRENQGQPVRVILTGAGAMGRGIAWQIRRTPGMQLVAVIDIDPAARMQAAEAHGGACTFVEPDDPLPRDGGLIVARDLDFLLERPELELDVLVEATNTIEFAARAVRRATAAGLHSVLMNAEVDLAVGHLLRKEAADKGLVVTSDAGDQHGVLMRMVEEIELWSFRVVMAGNIKGFLNRYATAEALDYEARIRNLNPVQCCAYTDGTKLGIEMALVADATGFIPWVPGMEGPRAEHVREVFHLFEFERYGQDGVVDYVLGAQPGGGVFVVGHCDDPVQTGYLKYYKMGDGPFYLFYRPYHLCHLETPRAIALAALYGQSVLDPSYGRVADVYAYAKRDVEAGEVIHEGIGGDAFYGLIERCRDADRRGGVPITLLTPEGGKARVRRRMRRDEPLSFEDVSLADSELLGLYRQQERMFVPV